MILFCPQISLKPFQELEWELAINTIRKVYLFKEIIDALVNYFLNREVDENKTVPVNSSLIQTILKRGN
mgnify:CR=1 FL=1